MNLIDSWSEAGEGYAVSCTTGQKLYVNFDKNTAKVE